MKSLKNFASEELNNEKLNTILGGGFISTTWTDNAGGSGSDQVADTDNDGNIDSGETVLYDDGLVGTVN